MTASTETVYNDMVTVDILGRMLFYNNSSFDGNNAAAGIADDSAIATDKQALLPGQAAGFANYSSYSRGINGLMIDMAGLPSYTLSADDFNFKVGNANDSATWTNAPAPSSIVVRQGAGISGSARVEILWADGAIQKQWLQVTIKATPQTGLAKDDVFYFGNAVGESGNTSNNALVNTTDQQGAQNNPANPAGITAVYDYNRDGLVNATDANLAAANTTTTANALALITPVVPAEVPQTSRMPLELYNWGDGDYPVYFAPTLVTTKTGVVLSFAEARATNGDATSYAIVMRRSTDGGVSWSSPMAVVSVPYSGASTTRIGSPTPVVDKITGDVVLVYNVTVANVYVVRSSDDGLTWTAPVDITSSVKVTEGNNPGPAGEFPDDPWDWSAVGPVHGIQLERGAHAGRLIVTANHRLTNDTSGISYSHVIYSDDHGVTWHLGGGMQGNSDHSPSTNDYTNENTIVELNDGTLYMSIRKIAPQNNYRSQAYSFDGGLHWTNSAYQVGIRPPSVQGSLLRLNGNTLLFSSLSNTVTDDRRSLSIWISKNEGQTWTLKKTVFFGAASYSDMTLVGPDTILLAYSRGQYGSGLIGGLGITNGEFKASIGLARINLRWLESNDPPEFDWYFNEQPAGTDANTLGPSIQDYGKWDQRAWPLSNGSPAPQYAAGQNGDTALTLTTGSDRVVLTQNNNISMQLEMGVSFTAQLSMKTTASNGVIIGTRPNIANWTLELVDGFVKFSLFDTYRRPSITSQTAINDGNWHTIAAVRDVPNDLIRLYIDGVEAAPAIIDSTVVPKRRSIDQLEPVVLGAYNTWDNANELAMTVDTVRFTQSVVNTADFLKSDFISPTPPAAPVFAQGDPTRLPGLQFWLPAYNPNYFFSTPNFTGPLPLNPFDGMASRSMLDASGNGFQVQINSELNHILYETDPTLGPYWKHTATTSVGAEAALNVLPTTGASPKNFDFVQNTGVFTLSTFARVDGETGGYQTIFDTSDGKTTLPGFSLFRKQDGSLQLSITASNSFIRFSGETGPGAMQVGNWYHIVVVGNGPGSPVKFYVTNVNSDKIGNVYTSSLSMAGVNGVYPTAANYNLFIGSRSYTSNTSTTEPYRPPSSFTPFNGGLVNEAIFSTALTPIQIQQLYQYGKSIYTPPYNNPLNRQDVNGNGRITAQDMVSIVNKLLAGQAGPLGDPALGTPVELYVDPTGDNNVTQQDLLAVINWLLANSAAPQAETAVAAGDDNSAPSDAPAESTPLTALAGDAAPLAAERLLNSELLILPPIATPNPSSNATSTAVGNAGSTTAPVTGAAAAQPSVLWAQASYSLKRSTASVADPAQTASLDEFFAQLGS